MMNSQHDHAERLSAFLDGELAADEVDALLEALENPACRAQLGRYASCSPRQTAVPGSAARRGTLLTAHCDISGAVSAVIRAEAGERQRSTVVSIGARAAGLLRHRRAMALGGMAMAASVAAVTVSVAPMMSAGPAVTLTSEVAASPSAPVQPVALRGAAGRVASLSANDQTGASGASAETASVERRELVIPVPRENLELNQLYLQHARFRGGYALTAPVSYGRVGVAAPAPVATTEQESR